MPKKPKKPVNLHPSSYFILHETYSLVKFSVLIKHRSGSGIPVKQIFSLFHSRFMVFRSRSRKQKVSTGL